MKEKLTLLLLLISFTASTATDGLVTLRGEISSRLLSKELVSVKDVFGQEYLLAKHHFPSQMKFKSGEKFVLELDPSVLLLNRLSKKN